MPGYDQVGEYGFVATAETDEVTGDFCAIHMLEDTVFSAITTRYGTFNTAIGSLTFPKGFLWYVGNCTSFTPASGSVIAYKNEK